MIWSLTDGCLWKLAFSRATTLDVSHAQIVASASRSGVKGATETQQPNGEEQEQSWTFYVWSPTDSHRSEHVV